MRVWEVMAAHTRARHISAMRLIGKIRQRLGWRASARGPMTPGSAAKLEGVKMRLRTYAVDRRAPRKARTVSCRRPPTRLFWTASRSDGKRCLSLLSHAQIRARHAWEPSRAPQSMSITLGTVAFHTRVQRSSRGDYYGAPAPLLCLDILFGGERRRIANAMPRTPVAWHCVLPKSPLTPRLSSPCCRLHHPLAVTVTHSLPHDGAAHNVVRRAAADGVGPFWTRAARRRRDSTETFSDNGNSVPSRPAAWSAVQLVWARGRCRHLRRSIGPWRWRRVRSRRRPACEAAMRPCSQSACVCVHSRARDCSLSRIRMGTVILCGLHRSRFQTPLGDGASKKRLRSRRIS